MKKNILFSKIKVNNFSKATSQILILSVTEREGLYKSTVYRTGAAAQCTVLTGKRATNKIAFINYYFWWCSSSRCTLPCCNFRSPNTSQTEIGVKVFLKSKLDFKRWLNLKRFQNWMKKIVKIVQVFISHLGKDFLSNYRYG